MQKDLHLALLADRAPGVEWTRTNYVSTHEYMTVEQNPEWYYLMCAAITRYGFPVSCFTYDYLYLRLHGYHYWWTRECINRTPTDDNDEADWGWDPVADEDHDHVPDNPEVVTRTSFLIDKLGVAPNRQL